MRRESIKLIIQSIKLKNIRSIKSLEIEFPPSAILFYGDIGRIDVGLGFGKRGSLDKNPVEESFFRLMISVTGGEKWFTRPR